MTTPTNVAELGAIADGQSHPLSKFYPSLAAARTVYPCARSLQSERDWAAIQTALDSVPAGGGTVHMPAGKYMLDYPLRVTKGSTTLRGDGPQTFLRSSLKGGMPLVLVVPPEYLPMPTRPSLVPGPGAAYDTSAGSLSAWLNFRDTGSAEFDGLSAFTAECFFRIDHMPGGGDDAIFVSRGCRTNYEPLTTAFSATLRADGTILTRLKTGNANLSLLSPAGAVRQGVVYHFAVSYDGTTARVFLNGSLVTRGSATGPIRQNYAEDVTVGASPRRWPDGAPDMGPIRGAIDAVRFSSVARYATPFTPPIGKPTIDNSTLLICNFEDVKDGICLVRGHPLFGTAYVLHKNQSAQFGGQIVIKDLAVNAENGCGLFLCNSTNCTIENVRASQSRDGIRLWNNCYNSNLTNVWAEGVQRLGIALGVACGNASIRNAQANGVVPVLISDAIGTVIDNVFAYGGRMKVALLVKGDAMVVDIRSFHTGDEGQNHPPEDAIVLAGLDVAVLTGCVTWYATYPIPGVTIQGGKAVTILGHNFFMPANAPCAVKVTNSPGEVNRIGCAKNQAGVPWQA